MLAMLMREDLIPLLGRITYLFLNKNAVGPQLDSHGKPQYISVLLNFDTYLKQRKPSLGEWVSCCPLLPHCAASFPQRGQIKR